MAPWFSLSRRSRTRPGTDASPADRFDDFVQLELERLEERCVLSVTAAIVMGELVISEDMAGDDEVSIQIDGGGDIEVFDNGMSIGTFSPDAITSGPDHGRSGDRRRSAHTAGHPGRRAELYHLGRRRYRGRHDQPGVECRDRRLPPVPLPDG